MKCDRIIDASMLVGGHYLDANKNEGLWTTSNCRGVKNRDVVVHHSYIMDMVNFSVKSLDCLTTKFVAKL